MRIEVVEATPEPEELACRAARNDYMTEWIGDKSFEEVMENVDGDSLEEKKENLITHLIRRGHYGPFEHPHATFTVEGVSRITMAQITRHRHASFDVQSLRYTEPNLGVTADPGVRSLPPGDGTKRRPGYRLDRNQEETVAEWVEGGLSVAAAAAVLGANETEVLEVVEDYDVSPGETMNGPRADGVGGMQVLGYVLGCGELEGDYVLVREDACESGYLKWIAELSGAGLYSVDGREVVAVWTGEALRGLRELGLDNSVAGVLRDLDGADRIGFLRGLFEAAGGFYGDAHFVASDEDTGAFADALTELCDADPKVEAVSAGHGVVADAEEVADLLYLDANGIKGLHKSRLLQAMDASEAVEERFSGAVGEWLDAQEFIYPPSVREREVVSREAGRVEFDYPVWRRVDALRRAYLRQSETYNRLREMGVPAEDARAVLGMGLKINMTFTMNARALMHLFDMRAAGDAQWEVRRLSEMLIERLKEWMPTTFSYYDEHLRNRKNRLGP